MKKSIIATTILSILTLGIIGISTVNASLPERSGLRNIVSIVLDIADELRSISSDVKLSSTQKAAIKAMLQETAPQAEELHNQMRTKRHELRDTLLQPSVDQARVDQLSQELAALNGQMAVLRIQTAARVVTVLTPEQKATVLQGLNEIDPMLEQLRDEVKSLIAEGRLLH